MQTEALQPISLRTEGRVVELVPGQRMDIPVDRACRLLMKADCRIWWRDAGTGRLTGPAVVDFAHRMEDGETWVFINDRDGARAINVKIIERILVANPVKQES
jgi:hypothetical protein